MRTAVGIDLGTSSARAIVVGIDTGRVMGEAESPYKSGRAGVLLNPEQPDLARQRPAAVLNAAIDATRRAVEAAAAKRGFSADAVAGIGVDATASTPMPVDESLKPLADDPRLGDEPAAKAWLWKDHTAHAEADEITRRARDTGEANLDACGGVYSSEWFWAKALRCLRDAPKVIDAAAAWVELSDFIPARLCGLTDADALPRNACAAGHKGLHNAAHGGWPSECFINELDPRLVHLRPSTEPVTSDTAIGTLDARVARRVGLPAGVPVAAGIIDAHAGAIGAGVRPGSLVKIMGTSTCDIAVVPMSRATGNAQGLCGAVPGSVIPGMLGIEAGQSAVGDIFDWHATRHTGLGHERLTKDAAKLRPGQSGLLALDWHNGNRSILTDPRLTGLVIGQTLHTTPAEMYRALIEATAFGARVITQQIERTGAPVKEIIACGGIAERSGLVIQIYADVLGRPVRVAPATQACALGAAVCGATAGGAFRTIDAAQKRMLPAGGRVCKPNRAAARVYDELFRLYQTLHDAFSGHNAVAASDASLTTHDVMKRLLDTRARA